ncbi:hypothetical protein KI387_003384, partial [Taxus chinensis]
ILFVITAITMDIWKDLVEPSKSNQKVNAPEIKKKEDTKFWKHKKEDDGKDKEKSMLVKIAFHAQDEGKLWYIDSGCSIHMTGDKSKFISLNKVNEGT